MGEMRMENNQNEIYGGESESTLRKPLLFLSVNMNSTRRQQDANSGHQRVKVSHSNISMIERAMLYNVTGLCNGIMWSGIKHYNKVI